MFERRESSVELSLDDVIKLHVLVRDTMSVNSVRGAVEYALSQYQLDKPSVSAEEDGLDYSDHKPNDADDDGKINADERIVLLDQLADEAQHESSLNQRILQEILKHPDFRIPVAVFTDLFCTAIEKIVPESEKNDDLFNYDQFCEYLYEHVLYAFSCMAASVYQEKFPDADFEFLAKAYLQEVKTLHGQQMMQDIDVDQYIEEAVRLDLPQLLSESFLDGKGGINLSVMEVMNRRINESRRALGKMSIVEQNLDDYAFDALYELGNCFSCVTIGDVQSIFKCVQKIAPERIRKEVMRRVMAILQQFVSGTITSAKIPDSLKGFRRHLFESALSASMLTKLEMEMGDAMDEFEDYGD